MVLEKYPSACLLKKRAIIAKPNRTKVINKLNIQAWWWHSREINCVKFVRP
jgi:hypothetical protein